MFLESIAPYTLGLDESPAVSLSSVRRRKAREREKVGVALNFEDGRIKTETMQIDKRINIGTDTVILEAENSTEEAVPNVVSENSQGRLISQASNICISEEDTDYYEFDIAGSPDIAKPLNMTLARHYDELHSIEH